MHMNISKKALALFTGSAVAIGGVASIGAQAFAQTSAVVPTVVSPTVSSPVEVTGLEAASSETPGSADVQVGHQDAAGTGSDATEIKGAEKKGVGDAPGGLNVQSGHQDAAGTASTSAR